MTLLHLKWLIGSLSVLFSLLIVMFSSNRKKATLLSIIVKRNLFIIGGIICTISFISIQTYEQQYQNRTQQIEQEMLEHAKQQIQQQALFIRSWIVNENKHAAERLHQQLQTTVTQATTTATHLVNQYQDTMSKAQLSKLVTDTLRPLRFNHDRGYIFATRLDGTTLLFNDHPELEGQNMLAFQDENGVYYVQEMVKLCREHGEGFVNYSISKPGSNSTNNRKIAYVAYFPPLDCFIGTGEYLDDFTAETKQIAIDRLHHLALGHSISIFGASYAGISLFGPGKGQNVINVQDQNGIFVVKELIHAAKQGGGFVQYQMPDKVTQNNYNKISYCLPIDGWQSYIGVGINLDYVTQSIAQSRNDLHKNITQQILQTAAFIPFIALFMWYVGRRFARNIEHNLATLKTSLHTAIVDNQPIDCSTICFDEFIAIAKSTNSILDQRRKTEQHMEQLAHFDQLTGLANRHWAGHCLEKLIQQQTTSPLWLFMFDLKRFKHINNAYGHRVGDHVLQTIAERIKLLQPKPLLTARLSSNEFIIVVEAEPDMTEQQIINNLKQSIRQPIQHQEFQLQTDCYISGVPLVQSSVSELLNAADITLRLVKTDNTDRDCLIYNEQLEQTIRKMEQMEEALRYAIQHPQQFELYFQPIWHLQNRILKGFEALVRWHHPTLGMVSPAEFIPLAEQKGLIVPLGKIIFDRACSTLSNWLKLYPQLNDKPLQLSVNMAPQQFITDHFIAEIKATMEYYSVPPGMLCFEITETSLMENPELAIERIKSLKEMGITIAVDDFGTGYSSLSYLDQFAVDTVKIDKSMIDNIVQEYSVQRICSAIISLSHDLNLQVVAEGIENEEQLQQLCILNCDAVQGFLIAKPLTEQKATSVLAQRVLPWSDIKTK